MELQTRISIPKSPNPISYRSETLLLGSCFAGHIAEKLTYYQFRSTVNPFGTLFHPRGISNLILRAIEDRKFREEECFYHMEQWHSYEVHSQMSRPDKEDLVKCLNTALKSTKEYLSRATHLTLTLGTAWGYVHRDTGNWVANCHKVPQQEFEKVLSPPEEIRSVLHSVLTAVYQVNPEISVILTVSPVRHARDGFVENQRSKSHLFVALHQLLEESYENQIHYFPAYELMMDELRDYRFYEADMLHPNSLATQYIWERFKNTCISEKAYPTMKQVEEVQRGLRHRPFHPDSESHKVFRKQLDQKISALQTRYPHMHFDQA